MAGMPTPLIFSCCILNFFFESRSSFGVTYAGEFSNGFNDCGLFLNGMSDRHSYGGDCGFWQDASLWNSTVKAGLKEFALASMDALGDWFFWTWKVGHPQVLFYTF